MSASFLMEGNSKRKSWSRVRQFFLCMIEIKKESTVNNKGVSGLLKISYALLLAECKPYLVDRLKASIRQKQVKRKLEQHVKQEESFDSSMMAGSSKHGAQPYAIKPNFPLGTNDYNHSFVSTLNNIGPSNAFFDVILAFFEAQFRIHSVFSWIIHCHFYRTSIAFTDEF